MTKRTKTPGFNPVSEPVGDVGECDAADFYELQYLQPRGVGLSSDINTELWPTLAEAETRARVLAVPSHIKRGRW